MLRFRVITEIHISRCFFINVLLDLECILTGLVLKASWPFANEKDLKHDLISL